MLDISSLLTGRDIKNFQSQPIILWRYAARRQHFGISCRARGDCIEIEVFQAAGDKSDGH
jgi:uncharacterized protein YijF (DUF1287 family)